jgi:histidinol-phosphatase (PHP family)
MELTDTHTHTWLSGHGEGTVEQVVQAAVARGLTTLALTEHLPLPQYIDTDGTFAMTLDQVDIYLAELSAARQAHPEIELLCGIEIDWRDQAEDFIAQSLASHDLKRHGLSNYDIMIASVHMLSDAEGNFWEFDHPDLIDGWYQRGEDNVWQEYLRLWCDAARSQLPFTVMAHPDLPKKLGFKPRFDTREYYAVMAEAAAAKDRLVEVNTSGLRKPVGELYPALPLLKAFCDAGVGCTVSSDAHTPADVGRDLDAAHAAMYAAGYRAVTVPTRSGDRRQIALDGLPAASACRPAASVGLPVASVGSPAASPSSTPSPGSSADGSAGFRHPDVG